MLRSAWSMVPHSTLRTMSRWPGGRCGSLLPVDHAVAAGAADRRAGDLAALGLAVLDRDVLGVQVDEPVADVLQPLVRVLAAR